MAAAAASRSRWASAATGGLILVVIFIVLTAAGGVGGAAAASLGRRARPARRRAAAGASRAPRWTCRTTATWSSSSASCWTTRTPCGPTRSSGRARQYTRDARWCCSRAGPSRAAVPRARRPGPFYCPLDQKVYIDLDFFRELTQPVRRAGRLRPGVRDRPRGRASRPAADRASSSRSAQLQQQDPSQQNELSVKLELQADCLAGVWAQSVYRAGRPRARATSRRASAPPSAVGDDRIQACAGVGRQPRDLDPRVGGAAVARGSTRASSSGDPAACDTFGG